MCDRPVDVALRQFEFAINELTGFSVEEWWTAITYEKLREASHRAADAEEELRVMLSIYGCIQLLKMTPQELLEKANICLASQRGVIEPSRKNQKRRRSTVAS